jgi:hypothetical protein
MLNKTIRQMQCNFTMSPHMDFYFKHNHFFETNNKPYLIPCTFQNTMGIMRCDCYSLRR